MIPLWLQIILGISAPAIAFFGAYISYKQWQLGRYKLKHDLFERRWQIYAAAHDAIATSINGTSSERLDTFKSLKVKIISAKFLFPTEIFDYLNELADQIYRLKMLEDSLGKASESRADITKKHEDVYKWLESQATLLAERLSPYLGLTI
jgi:hypothetical protein